MDGILFINKEKGMTSFDVVARLRKILKTKSIGHTGTLDPNAEGLLIVLVGKYTKLLPYCVHDNKGYRASFKLGALTDTQDVWGKVVKEKTIIPVTRLEFKKVLQSFLGKQKQIPPMYSAKKVNGKKLYELARNDIEIERKEIDINIVSLDLLSYGEEPCIEAVVSSGTYIRTLIEDINKKCGNYSYMTSLFRYKIDTVTIEESKRLAEINESCLINNPAKILNSKIEIIQDLRVNDIKNGKRLKIDSNSETVLLMNGNDMLAIYEREKENIYKCRRGLWS